MRCRARAKAASVGLRLDLTAFDDAAELVDLPYCRKLDLYVDRATKRRAGALHFGQAHLALVSSYCVVQV
jgi:hypothetical protein